MSNFTCICQYQREMLRIDFLEISEGGRPDILSSDFYGDMRDEVASLLTRVTANPCQCDDDCDCETDEEH